MKANTLKHRNIPIFIPHYGCENQCSFCNQHSITGDKKVPTVLEIDKMLATACEYYTKEELKNIQIAYFGGSFTAIDRSKMIEYLIVANKYIKQYEMLGIRISTRPDCITDEILDILEEYAVNSIELGVQSLDNDVLRNNNRGHTKEDASVAIALIKKRNIDLGLQMMVGLYGDTKEKLFNTANLIVEYSPDEVRIYPTVILKNTLLETLYKNGKYIPITMDLAIEYTSNLMILFNDKNIKILKVGLHASELISSEMVGGLYHPAFKELCDNYIYKNILLEKLKNKPAGRYSLIIKKGEISKVVGQSKSNIIYFKNKGYEFTIIQKDINVQQYYIKLE